MMEGKKMGSYKKDFEVAMFFSSQNIDFPFLFEVRAFLFFFLLFLILFLSFLYARLFEDSGISIIYEEKNTSQNFFSDEMEMNGRNEWLSHDYGNGGVVDISAVDAYSGMELCTTIFLGKARK
jgi:hypothetical protein